MADPYSTLGVSRSATEKDIKSAYRKLAKELHPDRNKDNPEAADRFGKVTQAYDLLSDKDKRAQFDRGEIDGDGNPTSPFGMGGGGFGGPREMHPAVCAQCGIDTEVPFLPRGDRPVYCSDCFSAMRR